MFYLDLFSALSKHKVEYVLIGGLAVALHGVERNTMDIDISVVITRENLDRMIGLARQLHLSPVLPVPLSSFGDINRWRYRRRAPVSPDGRSRWAALSVPLVHE